MEGFDTLILLLAILTIVAIVSSLVSFRAGAPILLGVLAVGMLAGEDGLGIVFNDARSAYQIGALALALILFDSGFGTPKAILRMAAAPALSLATVGVVITAGLVAAAAHYLFNWAWPQALLLGAFLSSTDAAAVFFLLRAGGIHLRERVRSVLEVESASNDPMAIFLTMLLVGWVAHGGDGSGALLEFVRQFGVAIPAGVAGGWLIAAGVNRLELDSGMYPVLVAAAALAVFAVTNLIGGSGFLAVYLAGLVAGNMQLRRVRELRRFQQGLTWLAQIAMFLALGLLATPREFGGLLGQGIVLGLILALLARPVAVYVCLAPFRLSAAELSFIALIGLRGAVSILLAILPILAGIDDARPMFNIVFLVVLVSLVLQGWGLKPLAQWLGLVVPTRHGPVDRIHLELPGDSAHELVAYRLQADSPLIAERRMPRWMRPALVVRDGRSIRTVRVDRLQAGDTIYVFVRPHRIALLDRLVGSPRVPDKNDREFFGDFSLGPETPMAELAEFYNASVKPGLMTLSVAHFLEREFGAGIEVGDRVSLGSLELIVRDLDVNRHVSEAGISLLKPSNG